MAEQIISDITLAEKLQDVFGIGNVVPADKSRGYHEVFFSDKKYATEAMKLFGEKGLGDHLGQNLGGFVETLRPNILIVLGNERQRSGNTELAEGAIALLRILSENKDAFQLMAGAGRASSRE